MQTINLVAMRPINILTTKQMRIHLNICLNY